MADEDIRSRHLLRRIGKRCASGAWPPLAAFLVAGAGIVCPSRLAADQPMRPPARTTVCSADQRFCAIADPAGPSIAVSAHGGSAPIWSLPAWHRQFFLANDGDHLVIGPDGLNLLPVETRLADPLLVFMNRRTVVRVVTVGDLFRKVSDLRRTVSHLEWGRVVGISARDQLVVELVGGRRVAFGLGSGREEPEK